MYSLKEGLSMRASVTGGAGFIGSNLVEALVDYCEVTMRDGFHTGQHEELGRGRKGLKGL